MIVRKELLTIPLKGKIIIEVKTDRDLTQAPPKTMTYRFSYLECRSVVYDGKPLELHSEEITLKK